MGRHRTVPLRHGRARSAADGVLRARPPGESASRCSTSRPTPRRTREARLRRALTAAEFWPDYPGTLPVLHDRLEATALRSLPRVLEQGFAALPDLTVPGGTAWMEGVRRAMASDPAWELPGQPKAMPAVPPAASDDLDPDTTAAPPRRFRTPRWGRFATLPLAFIATFALGLVAEFLLLNSPGPVAQPPAVVAALPPQAAAVPAPPAPAATSEAPPRPAASTATTPEAPPRVAEPTAAAGGGRAARGSRGGRTSRRATHGSRGRRASRGSRTSRRAGASRGRSGGGAARGGVAGTGGSVDFPVAGWAEGRGSLISGAGCCGNTSGPERPTGDGDRSGREWWKLRRPATAGSPLETRVSMAAPVADVLPMAPPRAPAPPVRVSSPPPSARTDAGDRPRVQPSLVPLPAGRTPDRGGAELHPDGVRHRSPVRGVRHRSVPDRIFARPAGDGRARCVPVIGGSASPAAVPGGRRAAGPARTRAGGSAGSRAAAARRRGTRGGSTQSSAAAARRGPSERPDGQAADLVPDLVQLRFERVQPALHAEDAERHQQVGEADQQQREQGAPRPAPFRQARDGKRAARSWKEPVRAVPRMRRRSTAGHAHVARHAGVLSPVDDEIVTLRLAGDRLVDRRLQTAPRPAGSRSGRRRSAASSWPRHM